MPPKDSILLVDDDRTIVAMISELLRKKGFNVITGFDAMQAMMGIRQDPKAVILDISMPGGNGLDILRKLRGMNKTSQLPVLIITASLEDKVAEEARSLGADAFLKKPVDLDALYRALMDALGRPVAD